MTTTEARYDIYNRYLNDLPLNEEETRLATESIKKVDMIGDILCNKGISDDTKMRLIKIVVGSKK